MGGLRCCRKFSQEASPPDREDILWVFEGFSEILFPRVSSLKPLLILWQVNPRLFTIWPGDLVKGLDCSCFELPLEKGGWTFPSSIRRSYGEEVKRQIQIFRKELNTLRGFKPLGKWRDYLDCFPENCFTESGYIAFSV